MTDCDNCGAPNAVLKLVDEKDDANSVTLCCFRCVLRYLVKNKFLASTDPRRDLLQEADLM